MQASKRLIAAAALALSMSSLAHAATVDPENWRALISMDAMEIMHMIDTGKTGKLTKDQFMKFQSNLFDRMDKNKDGYVTVQEWLGQAY